MRRADEPTDLAFELVKSGGADRDFAQFNLALELVNSLVAYWPARFPPRPFELEDKTLAQIEASLPSPAFALAFGHWRAAITELEATSAGRLLVVCSTLRKLFKLADRTEHAETLASIEAMVSRLASFLATAWTLDPPNENLDLRSWTSAQARRYDLLPRSWRHL